MATTLELATLSGNVYGGAGAPQLPPGWTQIDQLSVADTGFQGAAYKNTSTGEVVVAFAGTNDPKDLRSDLAIANGAIPPQFPQALQFFNDVAIANSGSPIYVTGHSLGGAEAQYVAQDPLTAGRVTGAETFGAPGIRGLPDVIDSSNVINHVAATDPIGNYGDHVGITNVVGALPDPLLPMATAAALGPLAGMGYLAYLSHQMDNYRNFFKNAQTAVPPYSCPIILDLDGDGIETTGVKAGAYFDHDGNGFAEQTGWVAPDDGMLVWDRNNDGRINDGKELFGNETVLSNGGKAANGFAALAELDANLDGKVDAVDAGFANLRVWKDINGDGITSAGELLSLSAAGVQSINTGFANSTFIDAQANEHRQVGSFTRTNGTTGTATDVWFRHDLVYTIAEQILPVPADVAALPDLQGYGNVYDLQQAIVRDTSGTLKTLVQDFMAQTDPAARNATLEQILFKWTGSEAIDPASRGGNIDARKLAVLEKFYGEAFVGTGGANPIATAAAPLNQSYQGLSEMMHGQLMAKTHLKDIYDLVTYTWDSATHSLKGNLNAVKTEFENRYALNPAATETLFGEFVRGVKGLKAEATLPLSILRSNETFAWLVDSLGLTKIEGTALNDTLNGTIASEGIRGGAGDDSLSGGGGNDVLYGNSGNDLINSQGGTDVIYGGDGNDTITDSNGNDTLEGGAGDDVINDQGSGSNVLRGGDGNDTVTFSYYSSNTIEGGAGGDLIQSSLQSYGQAIYSNTFTGGAGNDRIASGASTDTYNFSRGDGQDSINDYSYSAYGSAGGVDKLVFGAGIVASDVSVSRAGAHLVLKVADPVNPAAADQITVENWDNTYQRIEQVQFADGTMWTAAQLTNLAMTGTAGADALTLWSDATWADGQGGNDTITSGSNNATVYGGDGNDTITDSNGNDTLEGGAGDDVINDQGSGSNLLRGGDGNDTVTFSYYSSNTIEGGAGGDLIQSSLQSYGQAIYSNTFTGGAGNDRIASGASTDTYNFSRGDGQDSINDYSYSAYGSAGGVDKLVFGAGIVASDVSVSRAGAHLVLKVADPVNPAAADQITVENWDNTYQRIEQVQFADGSVFDLGAILMGTAEIDTLNGATLNDVIMGYAGNDTLSGGSGNDWLDGGVGQDVMIGGTGDDTFIVDDVSDVVTENTDEGVDNVQSSVTYTLGANLDALTLTGAAALNGTDNPLNNLLIGNSAINTLTAGSGNDILQGGAGNDILKDTAGTNLLAGGAGSDSLSGATGAELYLGGSGTDTLTTGTGTDILAFNRGDGLDTVVASSGQDNTLSLGGGIQNSDLVFRQSGNDLILDTGTSDSLLLQGWYTATTNHSILTLQLIEDAAAGFAPGGADPLRDNKVEQFNFAGLVDRFDQARSATPGLTRWGLSNALLDFYLGGSDSAALGGDLAYQYGHTGSLGNIGLGGAQSVLGNAQFGQLNQAINQPGLADGLVKLSA